MPSDELGDASPVDAVTYAYGVARDVDGALETALSGLRGVADAPVHLVRTADGAAEVIAVSPVPARDFRESALRAHLEDADWLESVARAHHRVIEELAARTTVLPLRLATICPDDDRARTLLEERRAAFAERLADLAGHEEWGVRIYAEPTAAGEGDAEQAAERVAAAARRHAVDHVQHRPQQDELARGSEENVINDAYLVPRQYAEGFRADALRAAEGLFGVRVDVTGPWAPYSFIAAMTSPGPSRRATP